MRKLFTVDSELLGGGVTQFEWNRNGTHLAAVGSKVCCLCCWGTESVCCWASVPAHAGMQTRVQQVNQVLPWAGLLLLLQERP